MVRRGAKNSNIAFREEGATYGNKNGFLTNILLSLFAPQLIILYSIILYIHPLNTKVLLDNDFP